MIFWVALRKELLEQWRSYRLLMVVVVLLVLGGLGSPLTAKYTPDIIKAALPNGEEIARLMPAPSAADSVEQYLKNVSQFGILLALLVTMGAVAGEKDKGTAALMLVKPMPRWVFVSAKFIATGVSFGLALLLAGAACYYYTMLLFEAMDIGAWLALNGLLLLSMLFYVALTLFCSTLADSQVVSGGLAFGLWMVMSIVGALPTIGDYMPGRLTAWADGLMYGASGAAWPALWVSLGVILVSLASAWMIFERQEL